MKKAKIMLLSIAVFASIGASLAFKIKKNGELDFCYITTNTEPQLGWCTYTATKVTFDRTVNSKIFYTFTTDPAKCSLASCRYSACGIKFEQ
jgi:hypothetical protein